MDADARIRHMNREHGPGIGVGLTLLFRAEWLALLGCLDYLRRDSDRAARRRVFDAIVNQIDQHLARAARIGPGIGQPTWDCRMKVDITLLGKRAHPIDARLD